MRHWWSGPIFSLIAAFAVLCVSPSCQAQCVGYEGVALASCAPGCFGETADANIPGASGNTNYLPDSHTIHCTGGSKCHDVTYITLTPNTVTCGPCPSCTNINCTNYNQCPPPPPPPVCQPNTPQPPGNGSGYWYWSTSSCTWVYQSCSGSGDGNGCGSSSPIVIDTDGFGFHLTSGSDGVLFDFFGNGQLLKLSWTEAGSTNGWLALDRNGNGLIDSAKELFGNITDQPPSKTPNGFRALAVFDLPENGGNDDGVIDSKDAVWPRLLVWIDTNHDGISQPGELHTLEEVGIKRIRLGYTLSPFTDGFGNRFRYKGSLKPLRDDDVDRVIYDVFLVPAAGDAP